MDTEDPKEASGTHDRESRRDRKREKSRDREQYNRERSHRHHRSEHRSDHHKSHHRSHRERSRSRSKSKDRNRDRDNHRRRERDSSDRHHHSHRRKRSRHEDEDPGRHHRKSRKANSPPLAERKKDRESADPLEPDMSNSSKLLDIVSKPTLIRDSWMQEPDAGFIDYTQKGVRKSAPQPVAKPDYRPIIHKNELNTQLKEGKSLDEYADETEEQVTYTFGDAGSKWRMTKLKRCYEFSKEERRAVESVALERYGNLKEFDEAREEEIELERRAMYGKDRRDVKEKPTGELYRQRMKMAEAEESTRQSAERERYGMKAALMKAQLRGDPKAAVMEKEFNEAMAAAMAANKKEPEVVVLSAMDSRMLAGLEGRVGREVVEGKKGKLVEKDDMSLDDMVREEKRTRGQVRGGEGMLLAERISRDAKFDDNLDYLDENAGRLAKRVQRNEVDLKNMAISEFKKMQKVLDSCPLCQHEDKPPIAPVVSLATRVYLTLPTEPELTPGGAVIVPIQHRVNMMECDDDEWEEVRNFMKSLTRHYTSKNQSVLFYENAASPERKRHAAITAIPLPQELGETAPAYFKEAILSADEEWSQHKKIIDTLAKARSGLGKMAFRRSLIKEMPYFHVWFEIDGGMGHIIEDTNRWPKGDLFVRELVGGMLECPPDVIKRQGRWVRGRDARVEGFRKRWGEFDWTKVLYDN
ncbi:CwfJ C-terminus 1-domain-containing protein-like protein [Tuber borchii]|uniref:CwfJ C-terminus 1-domain-containing protein-like protein n=1 Tax=Tuber borchii TaxID=42251 RepID=A0A2T6ZRK8_TUBBO|nr:CwfJ C-terminus 1-domain-containing protein-like protein [Tuber borchii]